MLRHYVWDYQPDLVMLQFFAANDVCNNSRELDPETGRPYYTLDGERLVLDDSFLQDPQRVRFQTSRWIKLKDFVVQHSRVAALIYQARHQKPAPIPTDGAEVGLAMEAFHEPDNPAWQDAWEITDRLVVEMASEAKSHDAEFAVLMANCGSRWIHRMRRASGCCSDSVSPTCCTRSGAWLRSGRPTDSP